LLRPWAEYDAAALREAIDEDVGHLKPWLSWTVDEPASLERTHDRLASWIGQFRDGLACRYAITPLVEPTVILGGTGLNHRVGPGAHDIGYWVRRSAARRGIAAAAVSKLAAHAFGDPAIGRLVIQCDIANEKSAAFARRLGFSYIGDVTNAWPDGTPRPIRQFELSRETYLRSHVAAFRERAAHVHLETAHSPASDSRMPDRKVRDSPEE
jgi:RimJ/RimL family protein N-acetyltransferase